VVERTFAWLGRCLTKDWESSIRNATASTLIASIRLRHQTHRKILDPLVNFRIRL